MGKIPEDSRKVELDSSVVELHPGVKQKSLIIPRWDCASLSLRPVSGQKNNSSWHPYSHEVEKIGLLR